MTTSSSQDQAPRVLFVGTPSDAAELARWTELQSSLAAADIETSCSIEGEIDYAVLTEDVLDGYCTAEEALALQKLRDRGVACASTCADPAQILATLAHNVPEVAPVVPISSAIPPKADLQVQDAV